MPSTPLACTARVLRARATRIRPVGHRGQLSPGTDTMDPVRPGQGHNIVDVPVKAGPFTVSLSTVLTVAAGQASCGRLLALIPGSIWEPGQGISVLVFRSGTVFNLENSARYSSQRASCPSGSRLWNSQRRDPWSVLNRKCRPSRKWQ